MTTATKTVKRFSKRARTHERMTSIAAKFAALCRANGFQATSQPTTNGHAVIFPKGGKPVSTRIVVSKFQGFRKTQNLKGIGIVVEDVPGRSAVAIEFRVK